MVWNGGSGGIHILGVAGDGAVQTLTQLEDTIRVVSRDGCSVHGVQGGDHTGLCRWCKDVRLEPPDVSRYRLVEDGDRILAVPETVSVQGRDPRMLQNRLANRIHGISVL